MSSLNQVTILGNLGRDPEIRTTQGGDRIANLNIATSESWKDKHTGEKKEQTEWHRVVIFSDGIAGVAEKYLRKGDTVLIQGQLRTRKWTDKDGQDRYTTEIVLTGFNGTLKMIRTGGKDGSTREGGSGSQGSFDGYGGRGGDGGPRDARGNPTESFSADLDDEIPF